MKIPVMLRTTFRDVKFINGMPFSLTLVSNAGQRHTLLTPIFLPLLSTPHLHSSPHIAASTVSVVGFWLAFVSTSNGFCAQILCLVRKRAETRGDERTFYEADRYDTSDPALAGF